MAKWESAVLIIASAAAVVLVLFLISAFMDAFMPTGTAQLNFGSDVMETLNAKWSETVGENAEFSGYLEVSGENVTGIRFIGEKDLDTGKVTLYKPAPVPTGYGIHSHPTGFCGQSENDVRFGSEKVACVQCGLDRIVCYARGGVSGS